MSDNDRDKLARLQGVLTELLQHQLSQSLEKVDESLQRWRRGELGPFDVHAEVVKHATRAERMAGRIARANHEVMGSVLRDAFDAKLIGRDQFVDLVGAEPETVEPSGGLEDEESWAPDKRKLVEELLAEGPVLVRVDARADDVQVPEQFRNDPRLVLRFGYSLSPAIADLEVDEEGISGTLTFGGRPFHCMLPWSSLYAVVAEPEQRGMVWPEDVPEEVLEELVPPATAGAGAGNRGPTSTGMGMGEAPQAAPAKPAKPRRRANHLKLVD